MVTCNMQQYRGMEMKCRAFLQLLYTFIVQIIGGTSHYDALTSSTASGVSCLDLMVDHVLRLF
ncbi:unnamed protein product [Linum tenue]|uniref:Uncharacterized protein n=1 Tax=Linum tenue TaxID=586396 RepID=A0AAV0R7R2_9ROSI|nr:unnamed protein product [Linum tenue]